MENRGKDTTYNRKKYLNEIERYIDKDVIKVLVGMRRSGKSVLMKQVIEYLINKRNISEDKILYIDKESFAFDFLKTSEDLYKYVEEKQPSYLLIDEVQEIENWEKAIASFHKKRIDVYITGSNAKMLSSDLATYLAGRYVSIPVYPLSFKEFIEFHNRERENVEEVFDHYLKLGGFPMLSQFKGDDQACHVLIRDIFETIILKDVISRHKIRRAHLLKNIIHYIVDNIGNLFSSSKVAEYLKSQRIQLNVETVHDYVGYLVSTFALHQVRRYDIRGKRHLEISEKYYLGDLGLRHALIGYRGDDINRFLENIVYLELLRRGYRVSVGKLGDCEIDFIAEKQDDKQYIQVCYLLATEAVFKREFGVLQQVRDSYPKLVLSLDGKSYGNSFEGIQRKNLIDWLLLDEN